MTAPVAERTGIEDEAATVLAWYEQDGRSLTIPFAGIAVGGCDIDPAWGHCHDDPRDPQVGMICVNPTAMAQGQSFVRLVVAHEIAHLIEPSDRHGNHHDLFFRLTWWSAVDGLGLGDALARHEDAEWEEVGVWL